MAEAGRRVLVAEDEYLVRLLVVDDLAASGYDVLEAGNGLDAIQLLEDPDGVDVLVTNIMMPGANGVEVALAARARHPAIPIIFISATPQMVGSHPDLEPYHSVSKPFDTSDLVRVVDAVSKPADVPAAAAEAAPGAGEGD
jgi:CheY-like chemotaxis protein